MDTIWIGFFVVLLLVSLWIIPRAGKAHNTSAEELLKSGLLRKQEKNYTDAEYFLAQALKTLSDQRNPDFSTQCSCLVQLADCYTKSGKYAEARQLYERLVEVWLKAINQGDPEVFMDIDYLASTGEFGAGTNDVTDCYGKVIEKKKLLFGESHADIATSLQVRSKLLARLGRNQEAEDLQMEANRIISGTEIKVIE